ncbi:MAG: hypothetical protein ACRC0X_06335 [Brevinema sp.]
MKYLLIILLIISGSVYGVEASYDGGSELILVERSTVEYIRNWTGSSLKIPMYSIYWNPSEYQYERDGSGSINITNIRYDLDLWKPSTYYYYVKDGSRLTKTNNIRYKLDPKRFEQTLEGISLDDELLYAGYISSNERLYIDKRTKEQYIKILEPIIDEYVLRPQIMRWNESSSTAYYVDGIGRGWTRSEEDGTIPPYLGYCYEGL